jgi:hypothetical protein
VGPRQIKGAIISSELVEADDWAGYFELLGHETERRWAAVDGDKGGFAEIAAAVLADVPMPVGFDSATLLADVVARRDLPTQEDPRAGFGEPPLTLFRGNEFFVSALYWLDGTTTIHQHSFSGAFRVLSGSSLHMPYDFDVREALSDRLKLGALDMHAPEILRCGDIRAIHYGDEFIHSLFHLERFGHGGHPDLRRRIPPTRLSATGSFSRPVSSGQLDGQAVPILAELAGDRSRSGPTSGAGLHRR